MARTMKKCLQSSLKIVNSVIASLGIAMIFYGLWMVRVWGRDVCDDCDAHHHDQDLKTTLPWFIHAFLGIGIALCGIACLGHFAAKTANIHCLSCYSIIIFILILLDTAMIADVLLNSNWEKDLPDDPSGRFDDFKKFVQDNIHICQWVALLIFLSQGCSMLIATIIRTLAEDEKYYQSHHDEEQVEGDHHHPPRMPLLNQPANSQVFPAYVIGEPQLFYHCPEDWKSAGF
ncbi:OLC1v1021558C1 [Oldenlandia corymbosa var. corymbosa]|uniref:OLC1v1021558C1 n=1 Tax=Oldenlandia corymbosa var. corymbosa TaxID=529605 RepID=A0AAV1BVX5_OLDCO|nr:OLC1v1021558C1 [Oldenlandia corymbosa var. corymbosa]